ncbi:MAG: hypothetical protein JWP25_3059 [Bradyrhizobium sp.]|nr:hypothetical protein [Bradyrhizobium sp.]
MIRGIKFFQKQADKVERTARVISDVEASQILFNLAKAYRRQAAVLKAKQKSRKMRNKTSGAKSRGT